MYSQKRQLGSWGEHIAKRYLLFKKYRICGTNIYNRYGEIDILATKQGVYHFVEVKTVSDTTYGLPEDSLTVYKQGCIQRTITHFIDENEHIVDWQVDIILIVVDKKKRKISLIFIPDYEFDEQLIESF